MVVPPNYPFVISFFHNRPAFGVPPILRHLHFCYPGTRDTSTYDSRGAHPTFHLTIGKTNPKI